MQRILNSPVKLLLKRNCKPAKFEGPFQSFMKVRVINRSSFGFSTVSNAATVQREANRAVGKWLLACSGMCFGAVVLGGITRLTESGLSITQWNLLKGMKPPITEQEWQEEFERYKQYPEYKYLERELTIDGFKRIFFWEYLHRMWGRSIAVVFLLPALNFLRKGYISKSLKPRLMIYGSLLAFQGALGWYMVKSGLEENSDPNALPRVSQYRLAAHLASAMLLYSLFLWQGLSHLLSPQPLPSMQNIARLNKFAHGGMALVFCTAISGAFVAGLDAGLVYNSWPKMANKWIPDDILSKQPQWKNFFENSSMTQFNHRHLGELTGCTVIGLWYLCSKYPLPRRIRLIANGMGLMAATQVGLGIATLLFYVPVWLAASHQAGAMTLLTFTIMLTHELRRFPK